MGNLPNPDMVVMEDMSFLTDRSLKRHKTLAYNTRPQPGTLQKKMFSRPTKNSYGE